ncbi:MAG: hypothetical protein IKQ91_01505 [Oscillospiraceae bacterium]|nr:hypothetical protein [Oscillospiraceae bacterium]
MKNSSHVEGIGTLLQTLPEEMQHWHRFGRIAELHFTQEWDDMHGRAVACAEMILTDDAEQYAIRLTLRNVRGRFAFDLQNGFCCGVSIQEYFGRGYEADSRFRFAAVEFASEEQGNNTAVYCERIKAELIEEKV